MTLVKMEHIQISVDLDGLHFSIGKEFTILFTTPLTMIFEKFWATKND